MQDLFATTFTLACSTSRSPFDLALDRVATWGSERVGQALNLHEAEQGRITTGKGWELAWWHLPTPSNDKEALNLTLSHPDREDAVMQWETSVVVSRSGVTTQGTVRLARGAAEPVLRPARFAMRPPGVVARLLDRPLHGYAGAIELKPVATRLEDESVQSFVDDVLAHTDRVLPVVVLATASALRISPSELARRLVGLAHVAVFTSQSTWQLFRDIVPTDQYVPPGGARIFWPGFGTNTDIHHRFWPKVRIDKPPLDAQLRRLLAPLSVARVARDRVPDQIRVTLAQEAIRRLREEVVSEHQEASAEVTEELEALERRYDELESEAIEALERSVGLENDNADLRARNASLSERLATAEDNLRAAYAWQEGVDEAEAEDDEQEPPDSWSEFGDRVRDLLSPGFQLTNRAFECALESNYPTPERMWRHLEDLAKAGAAYNVAAARVGQRFAEWIHENFGLEVALSDSSYRTHEFEFEGERLSRLPHVQIDDAVPASDVGRIYFAIDSKRARIVVDWFGVKRDRPT